MSTTKKSTYPACCPKCRSGDGWPVAAGTCDRPGVISVTLRCRSCGHDWAADAPKPPMASVKLWPRRPDRRRAPTPKHAR